MSGETGSACGCPDDWSGEHEGPLDLVVDEQALPLRDWRDTAELERARGGDTSSNGVLDPSRDRFWDDPTESQEINDELRIACSVAGEKEGRGKIREGDEALHLRAAEMLS